MLVRISAKVSFWLGFVFSIFCALLFGLDLAFNAYALPLKDTFNYTQTQVELVACMGTLGMALSFLEAICTGLLGYKVTCLVIAIGVPASSCLFALAAYYNHFFSSWPSLVCLIQLLLGILNCNAYLAITRVCVELFPKKHTSKLVSLYMGVSCCGKIYFGGIIELWFHNDLVGFFLSVAGLSAIFFGCCFTFLYPIATDKEMQNELGLDIKSVEKGNEEIESAPSAHQEILRSPFFHVTFWSSAITYGCGYTSVNNITTIAQSVGTEDPIYRVFLMSVIIFLVRLLFGVIFDRFLSLWCGFVLIMVSYVAFIAGMSSCMFFLDSTNIFLTTALIGVGMAAGMTTPVSVLLLQFGRHHYSALVGSFYAVVGTGQILLQLLIGFFYDSKIQQLGLTGTICYGRECFYWPVVIMLSISVVAAVLQTFNFSIAIHAYNQMKHKYQTF